MNRKKKYISPTLKQYPFQVETGFFASLFLSNIIGDDFNEFDESGMEKWDWDDENLGGNNFTDWNQ